MGYTKPEITSLVSASVAIQRQIGKSPSTSSDNTEYLQVTPPAYEADE